MASPLCPLGEPWFQERGRVEGMGKGMRVEGAELSLPLKDREVCSWCRLSFELLEASTSKPDPEVETR